MQRQSIAGSGGAEVNGGAMRRRFWSQSFGLAAVVAWLLSGPAAIAAEPATNQAVEASPVDAIVASFPVDSAGKAEEQYKKILAGGKGMVEALCSRVKPAAGGANDAAVRFALHGLVNHVARPGADSQRQLVAGVLAESVGSATEDVLDFYLEQLRFVADKSSIPVVEKLLMDDKTVNRAVAILTTVGGAPAEKALVNALPKSGEVCSAAIIQALGDMGSAACVAECIGRLDSTNAAVRGASLYALSRSGSSKAVDVLSSRRGNPPAGMDTDAVMNAYINSVERLAELGEGKRAVALAGKLLDDKAAGVAVRCRALAILGKTGDIAILPALIASLGDTNRSVRSQSVIQTAGLKGGKVTSALVAAAKSAKGATLAAILESLSSRPDFKDVALLESGLGSDDVLVRIAALEGLGRMDTGDAARAIVTAFEKADEQDRPAIAAAARGLKGRESLDALAVGLNATSPAVRETVIQLLAERRRTEHAGAILRLAGDPEQAVARAAFKALVVLAGNSDMNAMIEAGLASKDESYRSSMADTLAALAPRIDDRAKFAGQLVSAYKDSDDARRLWILPLLPAFGGTAAMETAAAAASSVEANVRDAGVRSLAAWPEDSALPVLLGIFARGTNDNSHALALPGVVRLLREAKGPVDRRIEMCSQALKAASSAADTWQVLSAVSAVHATGAIELVIPLLDRDDVKKEAALAIVAIACPETGDAPALPASQIAGLQKACDLVADKKRKDKLAARIATIGK